MSLSVYEDYSNIDYKIVVARYNEDIEWLEEFIPKVSIQNKGENKTIPSRLKHYSKQLPNIGLDEHSHLEWIVSNYECLPEIVIFTQANPYEHRDVYEHHPSEQNLKVIDTCNQYAYDLPSAASMMKHMIKQVVLYGKTQNAKTYVWGDGTPAAWSEFLIEEEDGIKNEMTLGQWFQEYVGKEMPDPTQFLWFKNAIFGVSKMYILSRSKSYYEKLLSYMTYKRHAFLHYNERSWYYILNMDIDMQPFSLFKMLQINISIFRTLERIALESQDGSLDKSIFFEGGDDISYKDIYMHKSENLFNLAKNANYILEIGFGSGHSTALMLLANPNSKLLIYDKGEHIYTRKCYEYLQSVFGKHRFLDCIWGDSKSTLQELYGNNKKYKQQFDLIHIDGGCKDMEILSDFTKCQNYASKDNVVVVGNYGNECVKRVTDMFLRRNIIKPSSGLHANFYGVYDHYIGHYVHE